MMSLNNEKEKLTEECHGLPVNSSGPALSFPLGTVHITLNIETITIKKSVRLKCLELLNRKRVLGLVSQSLLFTNKCEILLVISGQSHSRTRENGNSKDTLRGRGV